MYNIAYAYLNLYTAYDVIICIHIFQLYVMQIM